MTAIRARAEGADRLASGLAAGQQTLYSELRTTMNKSLLLIEGEARRNVKQDTRRLAGSITHRSSDRGGVLIGEVGPSLKYGFYVEHGRKPGKMPPVAALLPWVRRHTGVFSIATRRRSRSKRQRADDRRVAFLIARAIGRRGIPPAPFLIPAYEHNKGVITLLFQKIGVKVVSRIVGGR